MRALISIALTIAFSMALSVPTWGQMPVRRGPRWASFGRLRTTLYDHDSRPMLRGKSYLFTGIGDRSAPGLEPRTVLTFRGDVVVERGAGVHDRWPITYSRRSAFTVPGLKVLKAKGGIAIGFFSPEALAAFDLGGNQLWQIGEVFLREITDAELKTAEERQPPDVGFQVYGSLIPDDKRLVLSMDGVGVVGFLRPLSSAERNHFLDYVQELDRALLDTRNAERADERARPLTNLRLPQTTEAKVVEHVYYGEFDALRAMLAPQRGSQSLFGIPGMLELVNPIDQLFLNYHDCYALKYFYHAELRGPDDVNWVNTNLVSGESAFDDPDPYTTSLPLREEYAEVYQNVVSNKVGVFHSHETAVAPTYVPTYERFLDEYKRAHPPTVRRLEDNLLRLVTSQPPIRMTRPRTGTWSSTLGLPWEPMRSASFADAVDGVAGTIPPGWERGWQQDRSSGAFRLLIGEYAAFVPWATEVKGQRVAEPLYNPLAVLNPFLSLAGEETAIFIEDTAARPIEVDGRKGYSLVLPNTAIVVVMGDEDYWVFTLKGWRRPVAEHVEGFHAFLETIRFFPPGSDLPGGDEDATAATAEESPSSVDTVNLKFEDMLRFLAEGERALALLQLEEAESWHRKAAELDSTEGRVVLANFLLKLRAGVRQEDVANDRKQEHQPVTAKGRPIDVRTYEYRDHAAGRDLLAEAVEVLRSAVRRGSESATAKLRELGIAVDPRQEEKEAAKKPSLSTLFSRADDPIELYELLNQGASQPVPVLFRTSGGLAYICGIDPSTGAWRLENLPYKRIDDTLDEERETSRKHPQRAVTLEASRAFYQRQYPALDLALTGYRHVFAEVQDVTAAAAKAKSKKEWAPYGPVHEGLARGRLDEDAVTAACEFHARSNSGPMLFRRKEGAERTYLSLRRDWVVTWSIYFEELQEHLSMVDGVIARTGSYFGRTREEQLQVVLKNNSGPAVALDEFPEFYPTLERLLESAAAAPVREDLFK
jgi:hypothetical protein